MAAMKTAAQGRGGKLLRISNMRRDRAKKSGIARKTGGKVNLRGLVADKKKIPERVSDGESDAEKSGIQIACKGERTVIWS